MNTNNIDRIPDSRLTTRAGKKKEQKEAVIPGALLAFRSWLGMVSMKRDHAEPFTYDKVQYRVADLFAAMDEEDGDGEEGDGDSTGDSSSTGGAAAVVLQEGAAARRSARAQTALCGSWASCARTTCAR